ncbi:hypothetical protein MJO28_009596 [Puccinia striiformis f. sp. tritici]|nr:hypothetical protein Pst134EA_017544 [Puccinia striiformis f. sp. tritici]KAI9615260.1 hypothetical protein KEM48_005686 [Puccinia striiformis f. sp. tritici PST-130]KAH9450935.1 hypothetical protein Pst134EB_018443 [Puccinia striiformis f. sp. tritici]KAH9461236.1 hypothetical protein Pst134EA_017544 [Puccinia striiformis f. sp. tritici]KAI7947688.1 hypothetical protein MJO28_009596 [Puccinia striiformis f. sp. tritici]KAI7950717.1 hypothetical protein MJO29_009391 [Puccinia striiformis f.
MPPRKRTSTARKTRKQQNSPSPSPSPGPSSSHSDEVVSRSKSSAKRVKRNDSDGERTASIKEIPWPTFFQQLQRVYQALNTVFTFCSTRKQLHTTIENMRSSVEGLIKSQLELESIAQIKTLLPDLIRFTYVDKDTLGALDEISVPTQKKRNAKNLNVYDPQSSRSENPISEEEAVQVLLFQFLDGELKTAQKHARKLPSQHARQKNQSKPSTGSIQDTITAHDLVTPSYSPKMMIRMVEKRNLKFKEAVQELLQACAAEDPSVDPVQLLIECAITNDPIRIDDTGTHSNDCKLPMDLSSDVPTIETVLEQLKTGSQYHDQIVENGEHVTPARQACFKDLESSQLSPEICQALQSTKGITRLYSHQARAIDLLANGSNVIVTTSTSSGKSLIYQIPMLQALEKQQSSCGLYIFPTKALAQDQKRSLDELILSYGEPLSRLVRVETYDGDTPLDDRAGIRKDAKVIFTNPDMLHASILPNEELWRRFFQNLTFVVVDELHIYAGIFGSHVAMIMRRLRRVCEAVGNSEVRFISCSATTTNPEEHMKSLLGFDSVELVSEDGAPSGAKRHVIWNPPLIDIKDPGQGRVSAIVETSRVLRFLIERRVRTIVFCRIRKTCELLMKQVQEDLVESGRRELKDRVRSYRSGYTAQERRLIESEMFDGQLIGIIATTALELGIDIGGLDAVISLGFPHSLSGLIQQAGRAGRRNKESLAMLILEQRGLDQHFANHPEELFEAQGTSISLDLRNQRLLLAHLDCAAHEIPVVPDEDSKYFGPNLTDLCAEHLLVDGQGFYHSRQSNPSQLISIRGLSNTGNGLDGQSDSYSIIDSSDPRHPKILEEIERDRVLFECYEGAIFLHQGISLIVVDLNHPLRTVSVRNASVHYLTQPIVSKIVLPAKALRDLPIILPNSSNFVFLGKVQITTSITGYLKVDAKNRSKVLDRIELPSIPSANKDFRDGTDMAMSNVLAINTHGIWIDIPNSIIQSLVSIFKPNMTLDHNSSSSGTTVDLPSTAQTDLQSIINPSSSLYYHKINLIIHLLEHLILFIKFNKRPDDHNQNKEDQQQQGQQQTKASRNLLLHNRDHPLKTSCAFFKSSSFNSDGSLNSYRSYNNNSSADYMGSNHQDEFKLIERVLIYEDPKKTIDRSIHTDSQHLPQSLLQDANDDDSKGEVSALKDLFVSVHVILTELLNFLDRCECVHGCHSCVFKPMCPHLSILPTTHSDKNKDEDQGEDGENKDEDDHHEYLGVKFGVIVLVNGLMDRVWVPDE